LFLHSTVFAFLSFHFFSHSCLFILWLLFPFDVERLIPQFDLDVIQFSTFLFPEIIHLSICSPQPPTMSSKVTSIPDLTVASPSKVIARERIQRSQQRRAKQAATPPDLEASDDEHPLRPAHSSQMTAHSPMTPARPGKENSAPQGLDSGDLRMILKRLQSPASPLSHMPMLGTDDLALLPSGASSSSRGAAGAVYASGQLSNMNAAKVNELVSRTQEMRMFHLSIRDAVMSEMQRMAVDFHTFEKSVSEMRDALNAQHSLSKADADDRLHLLTTRLTKSLAEKNQILGDLQAKDMQLDELSHALDVAQAEVERTHGELAHMENIRRDNAQLTSQLVDVQTKLREAENKLSQAKSSVEVLVAEVRSLKEVKKEVESLRSELSSKSAAVTRLGEELEQSQTIGAEQSAMVDSLSAKLKAEESRVQEVSLNLASRDALVDKLTSEISLLRVDKIDQQRAMAEIQQENKGVKDQVATLLAKIAELEARPPVREFVPVVLSSQAPAASTVSTIQIVMEGALLGRSLLYGFPLVLKRQLAP
jgi:hypothetical protein